MEILKTSFILLFASSSKKTEESSEEFTFTFPQKMVPAQATLRFEPLISFVTIQVTRTPEKQTEP
jgi:hypothetical protein